MSTILNIPYLKTVNLGYKYRLYPTPEQQQLLNHQMFVYNQAYNICLNLKLKVCKKEEKTLNEIASTNNINPKNLQNWKKVFLENVEVAMEPAKAIKEYKEESAKLQAKLDEYDRVSFLKSDIKDYMKFYNYRRFHETLKYKKPMNVYFDSLKINDENYTKSNESVA